MVVSYIALGSNLGDRQNYIKSAITRISLLENTSVEKMSSLIETLPVGGPAQGAFLNAVIEIKTGQSVRQLFSRLQKIEQDLGRVCGIRNGPRTIDLDILLYGDAHINEEDLVIPHPRMMERDFVVVPLREIAPDVIEALTHESNPHH